jgi:hypothetical protein
MEQSTGAEVPLAQCPSKVAAAGGYVRSGLRFAKGASFELESLATAFAEGQRLGMRLKAVRDRDEPQ